MTVNSLISLARPLNTLLNPNDVKSRTAGAGPVRISFYGMESHFRNLVSILCINLPCNSSSSTNKIFLECSHNFFSLALNNIIDKLWL